MTYRVVISAEAKYNADEIHAWIAGRSQQGAATWAEAYLAALRKLGIDPLRPALASESRSFEIELRQLLFRTPRGLTYRILYRVDADVVDVLYVRGPGQKPVE